jgi:hypothetical protein
MSRDFDNIIKAIAKNHDELHKTENKIFKDVGGLSKDIDLLKREIKALNNKVDLILDILNNLSLLVLEEEEFDDEDDLEDFDTDQTWVPNEDEFWKNDENL